MTINTADAPVRLTHAKQAEAAHAVAALLDHIPAFSHTVDQYGVTVRVLNPMTFNRWAQTMTATHAGPMLASDENIERIAWGQVAGFPARVELVTL